MVAADGRRLSIVERIFERLPSFAPISCSQVSHNWKVVSEGTVGFTITNLSSLRIGGRTFYINLIGTVSELPWSF